MALRYPGGFISSTAPTVNANTAKGVWTLEEAMQYIRAGQWPVPTGNGDPYFQYNSILLPGQGTNGANNNTFLDSSTNNFTITRNGNTTQGTFTPFSQASGYWANYLGTTGNYFYLNGESGFAFGSSADFTIEFFFYANSFGGDVVFYDSRPTSTNGVYATLYYNNSSKVISYVVSSADRITGTSVISTSQWHHVVLTRLSGNTKLFVDGVQQGSTYADTNNYLNPSGRPTVCASGFSATGYLDGYISNFRVLNGTGFTSVTVPTSPFAVNTTNQILLIASSNRFIDANTATTAKTVNVGGSPQVTPFEPFGAPTSAYSASTVGGSGYFDGSGDYLTVPYSSQLQFTGDFTIEFWAYPLTQVSSFAGVVNNYSSWPSSTGFAIFCGHSSASSTKWCVALFSTFPAITSTNDYIKNAWSHIALVRSGTGSNNITLYVNGVASGTATSNNTVTGTADNWWIGATGDGPTTQNFTGYLSNFRAINSAVYTSAFTPPTAPLVAGSSKLLLSCTNGGITDATAKNDLETVGGASISTTVSKFGGSSMYFDGSGDYLFVPNTNLSFNFGTGDFTVEGWIYLSGTPASAGTIIDTRSSDALAEYHISISSSNKLDFIYSSSRVTSATSISNTTWTHFAITRSSGTIRLFINGTLDANTASYSGTVNASATPAIGGGRSGGTSAINGYYFNGYMNDLRMTKGVARYTANFTPPTSAFLTL